MWQAAVARWRAHPSLSRDFVAERELPARPARFADLPGEDEALLDSLLALGQVFPAALAADVEVRAALRAGLGALKEEVHA